MDESGFGVGEEARRRSNLFSFMTELGVGRYSELHRFSVEDLAGFWSRVIERLGIVFRRPPDSIVDLSRGPTDPRWLPGAKLNIAESCFGAEPSRTAIFCSGEDRSEIDAVSYGDLSSLSRRFASGLRRQGLRPGDSVAFYLPMTPECVAACLGTILAGCRVVSIAESFSSEELRRRMEVAGARAVVTVSAYRRGGREIDLYPKVREALAGLESESFAVVLRAGELSGRDRPWEDFLAGEGAEGHSAAPDEITNVLFSSGTTAAPKAIPWTHVTPLKCGMDAYFHQDVHPEDVIAWPTSIGWMMGPWLMYASLLNRAAMALYGGAPTSAGFTRFLREAQVTVLGVVPSIVRSWRSEGLLGQGELPSIRLFSSTGEASTDDDYAWLMTRARPRAPVIEYLGGTEIGGGHLTGTILHPCRPATFTAPALGVDFVVLDEKGQPVPEGATGELFLIPPALGMSQRLLNLDHDAIYYEGCPKGPRGEILRRHGDRIQVLPGGGFRAQGRADDAMNLGGIKAGPLELERVVAEHPAIVESAAVGFVPRGQRAEKLALFVVLREPIEKDLLERELSLLIARKLNPLFRVAEVIPLEALPRTASNKIMRRELRTLLSKNE
jgi:acetyl-CoA synthetase